MNSPVKVIFINHYYYPDISATSQLLTSLSKYLSGQDFEVHIVTSRQTYTDPEICLPKSAQLDGIHIHRLWTTRYGRQRLWGRLIDYMTFYSSMAWRLMLLTKAHDILVAKTDPPLVSVVVAVISSLKRARLVNWLQDLFPEVACALDVKGSRYFAPILKTMRNRSLKAAECNVVIGANMAKVLHAEGIPKDRIKVIHNWADGDVIKPLANQRNKLRVKWGLHDKFVIGYSGNMGRAHEFNTIVEAAERLRDDPRILFLFVGSGSQREFIEKEKRSRLLNNIEVKAYQPVKLLSEILTVPDIHLVSLKKSLEGLIVPSKLYGILAAGRPLIFLGDTHGETASIIDYARCGFSIASEDVDMMVLYILQLQRSPILCRKMGGRARLAHDSDYGKSQALSRWKALLEDCVAH